jgi:hypothetical protein
VERAKQDAAVYVSLGFEHRQRFVSKRQLSLP